MTSEQKYRKFFRSADKDGSGSLTLDELTAVCQKNGYKESEIKGFFRSLDSSGDGQISEREFLEAMGCVPPEQKEGAAMRTVFHEFDRNRDGKIEKGELKAMFAEMGKHFSDAEVKRMIELMDADGSGCVDYEEFIKYYTSSKK